MLVILLIVAQIVCFLIGGLIGESRNVKHFEITLIILDLQAYAKT